MVGRLWTLGDSTFSNDVSAFYKAQTQKSWTSQKNRLEAVFVWHGKDEILKREGEKELWKPTHTRKVRIATKKKGARKWGASKTGVGGCGNGGQKPHPRGKPGSPPTGQAHSPHSCTDFSWGMGRQWRVSQLRVTVALSHPKRESVVQNWAILGTWEQVKPTKAWSSPVRAPRWESVLGGSWRELESGQTS